MKMAERSDAMKNLEYSIIQWKKSLPDDAEMVKRLLLIEQKAKDYFMKDNPIYNEMKDFAAHLVGRIMDSKPQMDIISLAFNVVTTTNTTTKPEKETTRITQETTKFI